MNGHTHGGTYTWRNIHTEGHTHGGTYIRKRHIHYTACVDVLNHLFDGLSTRWAGLVCSTKNLVNENGAHSLDKYRDFGRGA